MQEWAKKIGVTVDANNLSKNSVFANLMNLSFRSDTNDGNNLNRLTNSGFPFSKDSNDINNVNDVNNPGLPGPNEPNQLYVHGPYGPPWPYVVKPVEIEFGDARVTIEIIDENAKLPLCWGISSDPNVKKETKAAIQTFCEWMQMEPNSVKPLFTELEAVREIKPFSINMQPVVTTVKQQTAAGGTDDPNSRGGLSRSRRTAARGRRARTMVKTTQQARPDIGHARDFAKLMHSPMIDIETLAKPVNEDENRTESALKYISLWGTQRVNINTAPRQVLESAFTFGGDSVEIAKQIIELRKEQPFTSVDELGKRLYSFYTSIDKAKPYITTTSDYFSIRVTATSGVAKVSATAGIKKDNKNVEQIGIIIE
jgi:DNA uptake protein ComE-like DNA-binding protein